MHTEFETEIPKQTWVMLQKPATYRVYKRKIQYGCQTAILKMPVTENQLSAANLALAEFP